MSASCPVRDNLSRAGYPVLPVEGTGLDVIQAPKPEPGVMRYELTGFEWPAIGRSFRTSRVAFPVLTTDASGTVSLVPHGLQTPSLSLRANRRDFPQPIRSSTRSRTLETSPANGTQRGQMNAPAGGASPLRLIRISATFTIAKMRSVKRAVSSASPVSGTERASTRMRTCRSLLPRQAFASPGSIAQEPSAGYPDRQGHRSPDQS